MSGFVPESPREGVRCERLGLSLKTRLNVPTNLLPQPSGGHTGAVWRLLIRNDISHMTHLDRCSGWRRGDSSSFLTDLSCGGQVLGSSRVSVGVS